MRIRLAVPEAHVTPEIINAALEATTRTDEELIRSGVVPTAREAIAGGVKWRPEPPGDEHFDAATTVMQRGHGDCDDLASWHSASLRVTGEDPGATTQVVPSGPNAWHAVTVRSDGAIDDPSAAAGMYDYYRFPVQPRLDRGHNQPHIRHTVVGDAYVARCDVPWKHTGLAISGHGWGQTWADAVRDAVHGPYVMGQAAGIVDPAHLAQLMALHALLSEADPAEVAEVMAASGMPRAHHVVGSIWDTVAKVAKMAVAPVMAEDTLLRKVPGYEKLSAMGPFAKERAEAMGALHSVYDPIGQGHHHRGHAAAAGAPADAAGFVSQGPDFSGIPGMGMPGHHPPIVPIIVRF